MKTPNVHQRPAIRGSRIAGFLLGVYNRNKTFCILISCVLFIFFSLSLTDLAQGVEVSSSFYSIDLIEFIQGGGGTSSTNEDAIFTAIGGLVGSVGELSSANFGLLSGQAYLFVSSFKLPEAMLISDLEAKTGILGSLIQEATWQKDNDPYFYWVIRVKPATEISGFSVSLDVEPELAIKTYEPYYQFPENSITSGKHTFYVLPFTSGNKWDKDSQLKFEIWVDVDPPVINSPSPSSGQILSSATVPITCAVSDTGSGLDLNSTTLSVNGSSATFTYSLQNQILEFKPTSSLSEGKNTVLLKAYDAVGNYIVKGWDFIVDTMPPTGSIKINNGEEFTHSAYVFLNIQAQDAITNVNNIYISNDGVFDIEMQRPYSYIPLISNWLLSEPDVDGMKTVYVKFQDSSGNISETYKASINLKRLTPDTRIISGPASATEETAAHFRFEASKSGCQFSYKLDNAFWSAWSDTKEASFSGLSDGNHYFYVKSGFDLNGDKTISIDEEDATPAQWVWAVKVEGAVEKLRRRILFWRR